MKKDTAIIKKLSVAAIILAVITISIIAFVGVFTKNLNKISNIVPNYNFSSEFTGNRIFSFVLNTSEEEKEVYVDENGNVKGDVKTDTTDSSEGLEVTVEGEENAVENNVEGYKKETRTIKANDDSVLTPESYKKSREVKEKRLEEIGATEYNIRLDEISGNLVVEIPEDKNVDYISELLQAKGKTWNGKFRVIDSQNGLELMNNSDVKSAKAVYNTNTKQVYLDIELNKQGSQALKDLSGKYVQTKVENTETNTEVSEESTNESENSENSADEEKTETKYIEISVDDTTLMKTYFEGEIEWSSLQIPIGSFSTVEQLQDYLKAAQAYATIINCGEMPNSYSLKNDDYMQSTITEKDITTVKCALGVIILVLSIVLVVKFGLNGIVGAILNVGFLGAASLSLRYTGVVITISSIFAGVFLIFANFLFMFELLSNLKKDGDNKKLFNEALSKYYLVIFPIVVISFVFSYMTSATIVGIGMVLFWGLIVELLYNLIFTKSLYILKGE